MKIIWKKKNKSYSPSHPFSKQLNKEPEDKISIKHPKLKNRRESMKDNLYPSYYSINFFFEVMRKWNQTCTTRRVKALVSYDNKRTLRRALYLHEFQRI